MRHCYKSPILPSFKYDGIRNDFAECDRMQSKSHRHTELRRTTKNMTQWRKKTQMWKNVLHLIFLMWEVFEIVSFFSLLFFFLYFSLVFSFFVGFFFFYINYSTSFHNENLVTRSNSLSVRTRKRVRVLCVGILLHGTDTVRPLAMWPHISPCVN